MIRYYVVTVFPELVEHYCSEGLLGRARRDGRVGLEVINPRQFTNDRHRSVDDSPYGGGSGMVMRPGPLVEAMEHADELHGAQHAARPRRILLTPQGKRFSQSVARELSGHAGLTLVCGRYEGVDERARRQIDMEVSLGDFVLMGGEIGALALVEATARLVPGVLGNPESVAEESHSSGLLEYPHYTRPAEFRGQSVPDVLISGDHARIARWRRRESFLRTLRRRPDLLEGRQLDREEKAWLNENRQEPG